MSNANGPTTTSSTFGHIACIDNDLFEVRAGIDVDWAASKAACLADSIERIASDAVEGGMPSEVAYLVAFVADAIKGLMQSVEGAYAGDKEATA